MERWLEQHMGLVAVAVPPLVPTAMGGPQRVNHEWITVVGALHRVTEPPATPYRGGTVGAHRVSLCMGHYPQRDNPGAGRRRWPHRVLGGRRAPPGRGAVSPPRRGEQAAFPPAARAGVRGKELDKA